MESSPPILPQPESQEPKESRRVVLFLSLALVFLIISATVGGMLFASSAGIKPGTVLAKLRSLTIAREKVLKGEKDNRINIVLLGMGGAGHEGATLTDTIVVASVRPSDGVVGLLSIPRDLQVLIPEQGYRRVNSVNAYAELKEKGSGGAATAQLISSLLAQPIHYYLRVDFEAFKKIIDTVGGIEVDVERSFYDPFYPNESYGYAPISFNAGVQTFNGERALQFVRSRHGTNGEGNDFARARRQQKVLLALKERLLSFDVLLRPKRIQGIIDSLETHIQTNIAFWGGLRFAKLLRKIETEHIRSRVLDADKDGVLQERNYNGAFVLEPKGGNWDTVREIAAHLLDETFIPTAPPPSFPAPTIPSPSDTARPTPATPTPALKPQEPLPQVEIQNGTFTVGLAALTAAKLETLGFAVPSIGNATLRDVETTVVYDLTGGANQESFDRLLKELHAIKGEGEPLNIQSTGSLDFVVILGANAVK